MATPTSQPQARPYATRRKVDSNRREHWQIYLPSDRGCAWVELIDFPDDQEFRDQILDPDFLPEWKQLWLEDAYQRFRDRENDRKRRSRGKQSEFGSEDDLLDPQLHAKRLRRDYVRAMVREGEAFDPEFQLIRQTDTEDAEKMVAEILLPLTDQQRKYITLSLGEDLSYADIARLEHPDADQAQINKLADAVRNSVNRAVKRIHKMFGTTRPDSPCPEDV
ncbi:sigma-70 RNA polymerase sigma factor region 4 domain-containing protein [Arcanobacterium ihumii]|uniref:sigma-70 family RNA polymerase sigma factor n=1 Tax=Arcanobacterium ihumii TaxID=2138162 RepID=UPI001F43F07D|nr:sigma-70 family RNA polymerase sigma factor [Arcanobacterium ihumii]